MILAVWKIAKDGSARPPGSHARKLFSRMPHDHHHIDAETGDRRVLVAILVNFGLTVAQIIGGVLSGSLALIADAIHNLSDALSLVIAFGARRIARRPASKTMTFGYVRVETVAALINYTTLIVIGIYLSYEAVLRFFDPQGVDGWIIVIIAGIALIIDTVTALLTYTLSKNSMNIRAAFLHNVADALGSVGVIIAGTLILLFGWNIVDPIVTLMIAGYILWQSFSEIGPVIRILMLGSPPDIDGDAIVQAIKDLPGVEDVHHVHLWRMSEHENALDAHIVLSSEFNTAAQELRTDIKFFLNDSFNISHATLEIESSHCGETTTFGHTERKSDS